MGALGTLLWAKALHEEAEPLMRRALEIGEASYGPEHPDVAAYLNNLAQLLQSRVNSIDYICKREKSSREPDFSNYF
jgi:hypothetical protein